jgi:hypothetical protein
LSATLQTVNTQIEVGSQPIIVTILLEITALALFAGFTILTIIALTKKDQKPATPT